MLNHESIKTSFGTIIGIIIAMILTASGVIFAKSLIFAIALYGLAGLIVCYILSFLIYFSLPRIYISPKKPKEIAREIYATAAKHGGSICATHIFPTSPDNNDDLAIIELSKARHDIDLTFTRILILDSVKDERLWLESLFSSLKDKIETTCHVLQKYPLSFPWLLKACLPRINLLLYQSSSGSKSISFIGLDKLHRNITTDDEDNKKNLNFAIYSRNQKIHRTLINYFNRITVSGHFRICSSPDDFYSAQRINSRVERVQPIISKIKDFAETTQGILHAGLFGSTARSVLGLYDARPKTRTEADVDILIVYDPSKYRSPRIELEEIIKSFLDFNSTRITWRPGEDTFYTFNKPEKLNIDIELLENKSEFYHSNQLLGYSIFSSYFSLYSSLDKAIVNLLTIPQAPLTERQRFNIIKNDRQGLNYFLEKMADYPKQTDPRRLCAHVLKNSIWAKTGMWAPSSYAAATYLEECNFGLDKDILRSARNLLGKSSDEIRADLISNYGIVKNLICDILTHN